MPRLSLPDSLHPESTRERTAGLWSTRDAEVLYHMPLWGSGYFAVNDAGHVTIAPREDRQLKADVYSVAKRLHQQGVRFPALIRFQDLLHARVVQLNESFRSAIRRHNYSGAYEGVFPIKVNQLREVVEEILDAGESYNFGLECGSKSELIAALPFLGQYDTLLLCNGCKDLRMMEMMVAGQTLGRRVYPIVERVEEYKMLRDAVTRFELTDGGGLVGSFGVRIRLSTSGAGLWSESGGANSKFGISLSNLIDLVEALREGDLEDRFHLLHFHLGSQIADIGNVRQAVQEAAQIYIWLHRQKIPVRYLDIGGGLGVNYEAGNSDAIGHINYDLDQYASSVVETLAEMLDAAGVPHPTLISESGRAITAHHSVLVVEAIGARGKDKLQAPPAEANHPLIVELKSLFDRLGGHPESGTVEEVFEAGLDVRARIMGAFRAGELSLEEKALSERLYWSLSHQTCSSAQELNIAPESAVRAELEPQLVDHYLCDFSVFRSMVDYWAIGQRFPIVPLHRLDERPTRRGMLDDLTCDSDGRVSDFVSPSGDKHHLELHPLREGEPYYLGFFLMGAYQDIMGDMHNLFGRVTEAHVYLDENEPENFYIEKIIQGADVREQLELVQYHVNELERRMSAMIQREVRAGRLRASQGVRLLEQYRASFGAYTYLDGTEKYEPAGNGRA